MSTRTEALIEDYRRMQELQRLSQGRLTFTAEPAQLPQVYHVTLRCKGKKQRPDGSIRDIQEHQISIYPGSNYPTQAPDLVWETPVFHPNIKGGSVCLLDGLWTPSIRLDEVCLMLWDMARYRIRTLSGFFNREAMEWASENDGDFPLDEDLRALVEQKRQGWGGPE